MKLFFSLIAGVLVTSMVGCNRTTDQAAVDTDPAMAIDVDTLNTGIQSVADRNLTIRPDTVGPTASIEEPSTEVSKPVDNNNANTFTETEVVGIDTISTNVKYDINRKVIEQVDTVGATRTYEIRRRVVKRTVTLDTVVETLDRQQEVEYEQGNYKVADERQLEDTVVTKTIPNTNTASTDEPTVNDRPAAQTPSATDTTALRNPVNTPADTTTQSSNQKVLRVTVDTTAQSGDQVKIIDPSVNVIDRDSIREN